MEHCIIQLGIFTRQFDSYPAVLYNFPLNNHFILNNIITLTTELEAFIELVNQKTEAERHTSICNKKERCLAAGHIVIEKPLKCSNVLSVKISNIH